MQAPETVHLDLASPSFTPEVQSQLDMAATLAGDLVMTPDALMAAATAQTGGMDDFGELRFTEPLGILCRAYSGEAGLSTVGTVMLWTQMVTLLKNRLLVEDLYRRHPEIEDVALERPLVIAGLPRTGTTVLHNLICTDPGLRHLPHWESLEPVLAEADRPAQGEEDPRLARARDSLGMLNAALPHLAKMHPMEPEEPHEEIQLLAMEFSTMLLETTALMPTYREWYTTTDQTPVYRYLRRVLKALSWQDTPRGLPRRRWVLKSPQHPEHLPALTATFPDASFVFTHRDPVAVTRSVVTVVAYTGWLNVAEPDPLTIYEYWAPRCEDLLRGTTEHRDLVPADRSIDVRFHEYMGNEINTVEDVYEMAELPMSDDVRAGMEQYMADHPRGSRGRVIHDDAQLGLDAEERYRALAFYMDRFGVPRER